MDSGLKAIKRCILCSLWILFCFHLVACNKNRYIVVNEDLQLPRKIEGASDKAVIEWQRKLNRSGAEVITIGQEYLISIPANNLFHDESPRIRWSSYALLNDAVSYMKQFRKIEVHVTAFEGHYISQKRERALSIARARNVANYLLSQGIDSRFIFMQGLGRDKPVSVGSGFGKDASPNARIEITFREAIV